MKVGAEKSNRVGKETVEDQGKSVHYVPTFKSQTFKDENMHFNARCA